VATFMFVVSREHPDTFALLVSEFRGAEVEVVLDRRFAERRRLTTPVPVERRHRQRRSGRGNTMLATLGWALVSEPPLGPDPGV
jgi:hypothetical protein